MVERIYLREGREEFQFHWWQKPGILPVRWDGKLTLLPWGCKNRRKPQPFGGWVSETQVESGMLAGASPFEVVIPANLGHQNGTWFLILQGIRGIVIETQDGPVVYMLMTGSTNYFRNMTEQSPTMPLFVDQVI
jgi:hypothetical protein